MNTPLGPKAKAAQEKRDAQEAVFREKYGVNSATTDSAKIRALKGASSRINQVASIPRTIKAVNDLLAASGRAPAFG
jgi:hypothetical protein